MSAQPKHIVSAGHPWRRSILISRGQREIQEERERVRAEAARVGRITARNERTARAIELSEDAPALPLDSDERDSALLAGLVAGTSPRRLAADE
jgi:hypothetical protein